MPALPTVAALKTTVNWGVEGDTSAQTVHYFTFTGGASAADLSTFAAAAVSEGATHFEAICSDSVGMLSTTARDLTSDMGNEATAGSPWVGTRGTALLPPSAAATVRHFIARHYRGGQPRTSLPCGVSADVALTGFWADAFVTAVETAWGAWTAALIGSTYGSLTISNLVNVSYYKGFTPFTEPSGRVRNRPTLRAVPVVDTITGHTVNKVIGSQRRRNRDA